MNKVKKIIVLVVLSLACFAAAAGLMDKTIDFLGMQHVGDANDAYLQEAFDRSLAGFLVLSGIKSGLAVIEGSEVGIGFNLEIGDIVQSVYDYVDIAWKTALAGGTVLLITRMSLEAVTTIDHWCPCADASGDGGFSHLGMVFHRLCPAGQCVSGGHAVFAGDDPDALLHSAVGHYCRIVCVQENHRSPDSVLPGGV